MRRCGISTDDTLKVAHLHNWIKLKTGARLTLISIKHHANYDVTAPQPIARALSTEMIRLPQSHLHTASYNIEIYLLFIYYYYLFIYLFIIVVGICLFIINMKHLFMGSGWIPRRRIDWTSHVNLCLFQEEIGFDLLFISGFVLLVGRLFVFWLALRQKEMVSCCSKWTRPINVTTNKSLPLPLPLPLPLLPPPPPLPPLFLLLLLMFPSPPSLQLLSICIQCLNAVSDVELRKHSDRTYCSA